MPACKPIREFVDGEAGPIRRLAWSPDGKRLASCTRHIFSVRAESDDWKPRPVKASSRAVTDVGWSPDGKHFLVTTGWPWEDDSLHLWNGDVTSKEHSLLVGPSCATALAWANDSRQAYLALGDGGLRTYDPDKNVLQVMRATAVPITAAVAWSSNGRFVASAGADCMCRLWDLRDSELVFAVKTNSHPIKTVAWSPKDDQIAVGGRDARLTILNARTGRVQREIQCAGFVMDATFSPTGQWIATAEASDTRRVWEVATGNEVCVDRTVPWEAVVCSVAWSPDGRYVAFGDWADEIRLLDMEQKKLLRSWSAGHGQVHALLWDPQTNLLASSGFHQGIRFWKVPEGQLARQQVGSLVQSVAVANGLGSVGLTNSSVQLRVRSPDGKRMVTRIGSSFGIKNLESGQIEKLLCPMLGEFGLTISPQGHGKGRTSSQETLIYVVQHADRQDNLTAEQFEER